MKYFVTAWLMLFILTLSAIGEDPTSTSSQNLQHFRQTTPPAAVVRPVTAGYSTDTAKAAEIAQCDQSGCRAPGVYYWSPMDGKWHRVLPPAGNNPTTTQPPQRPAQQPPQASPSPPAKPAVQNIPPPTTPPPPAGDEPERPRVPTPPETITPQNPLPLAIRSLRDRHDDLNDRFERLRQRFDDGFPDIEDALESRLLGRLKPKLDKIEDIAAAHPEILAKLATLAKQVPVLAKFGSALGIGAIGGPAGIGIALGGVVISSVLSWVIARRKKSASGGAAGLSAAMSGVAAVANMPAASPPEIVNVAMPDPELKLLYDGMAMAARSHPNGPEVIELIKSAAKQLRTQVRG
jgi:hypothetical protein